MLINLIISDNFFIYYILIHYNEKYHSIIRIYIKNIFANIKIELSEKNIFFNWKIKKKTVVNKITSRDIFTKKKN